MSVKRHLTLTTKVVLSIVSAVLFSSCAIPPESKDGKSKSILHRELFHAETAIQDEWQHLPIRGQNEYRLAVVDGKISIRAVGHGYASGLVRRVSVDTRQCPWIEWVWRVEVIQPDADIRVKESEDVAASIFLLFGDTDLAIDFKKIPTLRYVWTNDKVSEGTVVDNPYFPETVRSIVIRSGSKQVGKWITERRNLAIDFQQAFGYHPKVPIEAIALFTDNDQTKQPVEASYAWARVLCTAGR